MFQEFKNELFDQIVISNHQINLLFPDFDPRNLTRWANRGYVVRLRKGIYTFPEYLKREGLPLYFANRMYRPSYISLHYALSFYGFISEMISDLTSVTTLKTTSFRNPAGYFTYQTIQPAFFMGYEPRKISDVTILFATPEKALIDLFYLYPEYNDPDEIENLRLDGQMMLGSLHKANLLHYLDEMKIQSLTRRIRLMLEIYEL
ncbi:MAG: hypothetical protein PHD25_10320 [Bacteroidales bacterium]|nr:hypothetical protein [Bacteroidales bacterium]